MATPPDSPIVHAVLADPVVKAVLSEPSAIPQVEAAIEGAPAPSQPAPAPTAKPLPSPAPATATATVESGTSTTKTIVGTVTTASGQIVASPTSTEEEDRGTASQRTVNLIWETTQMRVALSVIWSSLIVACALAVLGKHIGTPDIQLAAVVFLFGVANLVTGFYFGRTNHQKVGGIMQGR